jgi:hypothetical protein
MSRVIVCFCVFCGFGAYIIPVLIADLTDEAVVDLPPHNHFTIKLFFLMNHYMINQCVKQWSRKLLDVDIALYQCRKTGRVVFFLFVFRLRRLKLCNPLFYIAISNRSLIRVLLLQTGHSSHSKLSISFISNFPERPNSLSCDNRTNRNYHSQ